MAASSLKRDTLHFILQHTSVAIDKQIAAADAMDGKANAIFGVASAVVGLAALSAAVSNTITTSATGTSSTVQIDAPLTVTVLLFAALCAYVVTALATIASWWFREFQTGDYGATLWPEHWNDDLAEVQHMVAASIPDIVEHNRGLLREKAALLTMALVACGLEVGLVGTAVAVQTI